MSDTFDMEIVRTVHVQVLTYTPARGARLRMDPNDSSPPEPEEFECVAQDAAGKPVDLTPDEIEEARRIYLDSLADDGPDDDDAFDRYYDR
jgi:hypothetical protein